MYGDNEAYQTRLFVLLQTGSHSLQKICSYSWAQKAKIKWSGGKKIYVHSQKKIQQSSEEKVGLSGLYFCAHNRKLASNGSFLKGK